MGVVGQLTHLLVDDAPRRPGRLAGGDQERSESGGSCCDTNPIPTS
jgi:hypothetical protein